MRRESLRTKRKRNEISDSADKIDRDRISELPEHIIHLIFSFLRTKDVAKASVLSKKFQCAWLSYPNLDFNQAFFRKEIKGVVKWVPDKFIEYVENTIQRFCADKLCIQKFKLYMTLEHFGQHTPLINKWIDFAVQNHVKELKLHVPTSLLAWYNLPQEIFACKSISVLELCSCELPLSNGTVRLPALQKLSLKEVRVNQLIMEDLLTSCPSIVHFSLKKCTGLKNLCISGLLKLKILELIIEGATLGYEKLERVDIEAASLQSLTIFCQNSTTINLAASKELKVLTLEKGKMVTDQLFNDLMAKFPLLEILHLDQSGRLQMVNISGDHLRNLKINNWDNVLHIVSAPHSDSFFFSLRAPCLRELPPETRKKIHLNNSWYSELKEFLCQAAKVHTLTLSFPWAEITSAFPEEKSQVSLAPLCELEHLIIGIETSQPNYAAIVNGLLWSCHPNTLSIASGSDSANNFIKFLCENLIGSEDPNCCSTSGFKCWRHYLKDSKIETIKRAKKDNPHNWITHAYVPHGYKMRRCRRAIPNVVSKEKPIKWNTLLNALPKLGAGHVHCSLNWR